MFAASIRTMFRNVTAGLAAATAIATLATAQCPTVLRAGEGYPGAGGPILASLLWDPDGAGPRTPVLVVGGQFGAIGNVTCTCVATFDPATDTWSSLSSGITGPQPEVTALAVLPNGDLVAAGRFDSLDGIAASNIARWNGTTWSPLGTGLQRTFSTAAVTALTVAGNGDLVAGGRFDRAGGTVVQDVARWNGTTWSAMSGPSSTVDALATLPNGDVVVGGNAGSSSCIARWSGTNWVPLSQGVQGAARALAIAPNGDLLACGSLSVAGTGGFFRVGRWNGTAWTLIAASGGEFDSILGLANGDVLLGGAYDRITTTVVTPSIARWNGTNWSAMGSGLGINIGGTNNFRTVRCLTQLPDGTVFAGGTFENSGNVAMSYAARWDGAAWQPMSDQRAPVGAWIRALVPTATGGFYATTGGALTAGGTLSPLAARWDGSAWQAMPGLVYSPGPPYSRCMLEADGIGLLLGSVMNGFPLSSPLQRWTGSTWVPFAASLPDVRALAQLQNGAIVVGLSLPSLGNLATSTGGAWTTLGGGTNGPVSGLRRLRNGDLLVGGAFAQAGAVPANRIARWNGSSWSALGNGLPGAVSLVEELPNGDLVAAYEDVSGYVRKVAQWNGTTWTTLGNATDQWIEALLALPDGDVLIGGLFTTVGGVPAVGLARWRGGAWQAVPGIEGYVSALAMSSTGEIGVGGAFWAPSVGSANFVRLASGCPAAVTSTATACVGPAGPLASAATALPWLGSTLRIRTTGYAPGSLAAVLTGFQAANVPLAAVHPAGLPGCSVLTSIDAVQFAVPVAGVVDVAIQIPNDPALIGVALRHQQLQAGLDAAGALVSLSSSNLLQSVVGDF